jgi:hypothetical protein
VAAIQKSERRYRRHWVFGSTQALESAFSPFSKGKTPKMDSNALNLGSNTSWNEYLARTKAKLPLHQTPTKFCDQNSKSKITFKWDPFCIDRFNLAEGPEMMVKSRNERRQFFPKQCVALGTPTNPCCGRFSPKQVDHQTDPEHGSVWNGKEIINLHNYTQLFFITHNII